MKKVWHTFTWGSSAPPKQNLQDTNPRPWMDDYHHQQHHSSQQPHRSPTTMLPGVGGSNVVVGLGAQQSSIGPYGSPAIGNNGGIETALTHHQMLMMDQRISPINGATVVGSALLVGPSAAVNPTNAGTSTSALELAIDFTRPDGQRTRPLLIDGKRLYVDEHYVSVWSPILRSWCIECPDRELILADVQYDHVLELLLAIHPTYKQIDDQTVHILLPLAFDYQMDGLLHRCECFLITTKLPFLEKVWLADRYQLNRLLALLLRELRPTHKLDLTGSRYYGLSDRVKVLLLERMHGSPPPEELPEPPVDMEHFLNASDLNFASVRAKTGRSYYVNPYYVAAWSTIFQERLSSMNVADDIYCPCAHEELKYFLMAIYPPQLRINETNIGPILMAACKMESHGLLRKCAQILLTPQTQLSVFVRLSLLDRCKLQELLDQCLTMVHRPEHLVEMTQQQTYDCLSIRARAALMDRFTVLVQQMGITLQHLCHRCKLLSPCQEVTWMCPQCKAYSTGELGNVGATAAASPNVHKMIANSGHQLQKHHQQQQQLGGQTPQEQLSQGNLAQAAASPHHHRKQSTNPSGGAMSNSSSAYYQQGSGGTASGTGGASPNHNPPPARGSSTHR